MTDTFSAVDLLLCTTPFRECPVCSVQDGFMRRVSQKMIITAVHVGDRHIIRHICPVCKHSDPSDKAMERYRGSEATG